eukprot:TRINITY_DN916_c0_g1_i3.p1 TRINITY_DN916_c0_g1~~TRINITY_DN916_c0_g1_i3.p1  ORF type:complete len:157 (+),score=23.58 TRINITY_DN916_c0_g1_i3:117-587(+)
MLQILFLSALLFVLGCESLTTVSTDCSSIEGYGSIYDLSPLIEYTSLAKMELVNSSVSLCSNDLACGSCSVAGYCEKISREGQIPWDICIGTFKGGRALAPEEFPSGGVDLFYSGGDFDTIGIVRILCDPEAGEMRNITEIDVRTSQYTLMKSKKD